MPRKQPQAIMALVVLLLAAGFAGTGWAEDTALDPAVEQHLKSLPDDLTRAEYLEGLLAESPDDATLHFGLGNVHFDLGQLDDAVASYEKSVELDPEFLKAYVNLGSAYDEMGLLDKALTTYEKALELDPNEEKTLCNIGGVYFKQRQIDKALASFQHALEANPGSQLAHYNLAILFADSGIYREAIMEWQAAVDIDPESDLGTRSRDNIEIIRQMQEAELPDLGSDE